MGFVHNLRSSVAREGWATALAKLWRRVEDRWFDARHGVRTGGIVEPDDLDVTGLRAEQAEGYCGAGVREFREAMALLPPDRGGAFLDVGCGKGRVLLMAARLGFDRVAGIDISPALTATARANVDRRPRGTPIEVECRDVRDLVLRGDERVVFLYNPFRADLVAVLVEEIARSLREHPRPLFVLYGNPQHRHVVDGVAELVPYAEYEGTRMDVMIVTASAGSASRRRQ